MLGLALLLAVGIGLPVAAPASSGGGLCTIVSNRTNLPVSFITWQWNGSSFIATSLSGWHWLSEYPGYETFQCRYNFFNVPTYVWAYWYDFGQARSQPWNWAGSTAVGAGNPN
jgi:hypothetical protein